MGRENQTLFGLKMGGFQEAGRKHPQKMLMVLNLIWHVSCFSRKEGSPCKRISATGVIPPPPTHPFVGDYPNVEAVSPVKKDPSYEDFHNKSLVPCESLTY